MLFDPFGWFGRVTTFGPVPEQMPEAIFDIGEGLFGVDVAVVVGPTGDDWIEGLDQVGDGSLTMAQQAVFEVSEMGLHLLLLRLDKQFVFVATDVETQEVEALAAVNNPGFGFIED